MPYIVSGGRLEYRGTISRKAHGRKNAGEIGRRLKKDGAYHFTKGWRAVPAPGVGMTLLCVPPGPQATGTHAPRIYAPVARAKGLGGKGTPTVGAYMVPHGTGMLAKQPRAVRRLYAKKARCLELRAGGDA